MNVTDQDFDEAISEGIVLVDFWAEWCTPCKMVSPVIGELAKEYEGKVTVLKMDVDENPDTSMKFQIRSIPTVMIFKDGQPVQGIVGVRGKDEYVKAINEVVGS